MTQGENVKGASSLHKLRQCAHGMFDGDSRVHPYQSNGCISNLSRSSTREIQPHLCA